jgi:hypothetical protein
LTYFPTTHDVAFGISRNYSTLAAAVYLNAGGGATIGVGNVNNKYGRAHVKLPWLSGKYYFFLF